MKKFNVCALAAMASLFVPAQSLFAKSGGTHEFGVTYRYESAKSPSSTYSFHEFDTFWLVPVKFFWAGGEFGYARNQTTSYSTSRLQLGGLAKYWIVDPGGSVGLNIFSGMAIGREDSGSDPVSVFTLKAGPELAWFVWEGAAVSTRIQYETRRAGPTYTVLGIHTGVSLFF
jgi:hypothetical protein